MWSASEQLDSGAGGFLDQSYNTSTQQPKQDSVRGSAILPIKIGHLLKVSPDNFNLWGVQAKLICIVAYVNKVDRVTTKISYEMLDDTGSIMAFQWVEDGQSCGSVVPECSYARIVGSPRQQGETPHVFILSIDPVTVYADVVIHQLEVSLLSYKGKQLFSEDETVQFTDAMDEQDFDSYHGMNSEQALVFKVIKSDNTADSGIERSKIRSQVPAGIRGKLDEILDFLVCEGHIYTTSNDDHFKTT